MRSAEGREKLLPKDGLTLANAVAGLAAIYEALYFDLFNAFVLLLAAVAFDFLDGYLARKSRQGPTELGTQLDSLADAVSFGIAPVIIAATAVTRVAFLSNPEMQLPAIAFYSASAFYLVCVLVRLAKFNIQKEEKVYYGLPGPAAAVIVSVASVFLKQNIVDYALLIQTIILVLAGALMISRFRIKKFW